MKAAVSPSRIAFDDLADRAADIRSVLVPRPAPHRPRRGDPGHAAGRRAGDGDRGPGAEPVAMERRHPAGVFEALLEGVHEIPDYRLRVVYPGGLRGRDRRPVSVRPHHRRLRSLPVRRRQPHPHLRQARRAPDAHRRLRRRALRGLGPERPPRQRRRRLQRLGRPRAPDARARIERRVGDLHPRGARRASLQVRDPHRATATSCSRSIPTGSPSRCRR